MSSDAPPKIDESNGSGEPGANEAPTPSPDATPKNKRDGQRSKAWLSAKEKEDGHHVIDEEKEAFYKTVLPLDFLSREMANEVRDGYLVRELYVYIPFMVLFMFFTLNQLPVQQSHFAVQALKDSIVEKQFDSVQAQNKTLWSTLKAKDPIMMAIDKRHADIANDGDWLNYMRHTARVLWHCGNESESYPTIPNPPYSHANVKGNMSIPFKGQLYGIGAVRLRTLRVRSDSCRISGDVTVNPNDYPDRYSITDHHCWSGHKDEHEDKTPWCNLTNPLATPFNQSSHMYTYSNCADIPGSWTTTEQGSYQCGGYLVEIPFTASCSQAMEVIATLEDEDCPYVDLIATRFVIMEFFTYSPSLDTFFSVKAFNEVTPGGAWIPDSQFRGFALWTSSMITQTILDFVFLLFVLYYFFHFLGNLSQFYHDERSILRFFLVAWNLIEFINVLTFIVVFFLRWTWWDESTKVHKTFPFPNIYPDLENPLWTFSQMRYASAFNFILTFLKVLKYLKISQKLNVIAVTFEKSQTDVLGLLVIFVLVLTGYAIAGTSVFGPQMWWFSTIGRSFSGLMFMLMGQMDYLAMKKVNPTLTGFYFWSFLILSFFLLLNFIVAVVSEAFNAAGEQEWSLSLGDAFELSLDGAWRSYSPSALSREFKYVCAGHSSLYLRSQALSYIQQNEVYLKLKYPTSLDIPVQASEVLKWVPVGMRKNYAPLFEEDWELFLAMHKLLADSDDEQIEKMRKEVVVDGCRKIIQGSKIEEDIKAMETSLSGLEQSAKDAIRAVRKKLGKPDEPEINTRAKSKGNLKSGSSFRRTGSRVVGQSDEFSPL